MPLRAAAAVLSACVATTLCLLVVPGPTQASVPGTWEQLWMTTGGRHWRDCNDASVRRKPCGCKRVKCTAEGRLLELRLSGIGMTGTLNPDVIWGLVNVEGVKLIDFSGNKKLHTKKGECVDFTEVGCVPSQADCRFPPGVKVCGTATPTATSSLDAWQRLFDVTNGKKWKACQKTRNRPCECKRNTCNAQKTVVEAIDLAKNGLNGFIDHRLVWSLQATGTRSLDFSGNEKLRTAPGQCLDLPLATACYFRDYFCAFPPTVVLCPTRSPSAAPSTKVKGTPFPTVKQQGGGGR